LNYLIFSTILKKDEKREVMFIVICAFSHLLMLYFIIAGLNNFNFGVKNLNIWGVLINLYFQFILAFTSELFMSEKHKQGRSKLYAEWRKAKREHYEYCNKNGIESPLPEPMSWESMAP